MPARGVHSVPTSRVFTVSMCPASARCGCSVPIPGASMPHGCGTWTAVTQTRPPASPDLLGTIPEHFLTRTSVPLGTVWGQPHTPCPRCRCPCGATPTQPCPFSLPAQTLSLAGESSGGCHVPAPLSPSRAGPARLVSPVTRRRPDHPAPRAAPLDAAGAVGPGDTDLPGLGHRRCHHLVQGRAALAAAGTRPICCH